MCASTKTSVTNNTGATPGTATVRRIGIRPPRSCPGWSGTTATTHPMSTTATPVMTENVTRHPTAPPRNVPAGTPSDNATGMPAMTTAIALPSSRAGAIRRAYPASNAHTSPAATPATNRPAMTSA